MTSRLGRILLAGVFALGVGIASTANAAETKMGVVVKIGGIPWFNAMEAGIKQRAKELGVNAFMVGPTSADPALQVRAVEDLIAQGVNVIGVVPNDAEVLEPVLQRARDAGIKVITHESPEAEERGLELRAGVGQWLRRRLWQDAGRQAGR